MKAAIDKLYADAKEMATQIGELVQEIEYVESNPDDMSDYESVCELARRLGNAEEYVAGLRAKALRLAALLKRREAVPS